MINGLKSRVDKLEASIKIKDNVIQKQADHIEILESRVNQVDQYAKRQNLRIYGVEVKTVNGKAVSEKEDDVMKLVKKTHEEVGVDFKPDTIQRAHRVGKPTKDEHSGKTVQPIIVRFKDWNARCALYRARPTVHKPITKKSFKSIGQDATKANLDLLKIAQDYAKDDQGVKYACLDINCNLVIANKNGTFKHFNNINDLNRIFEKDVKKD